MRHTSFAPLFVGFQNHFAVGNLRGGFIFKRQGPQKLIAVVYPSIKGYYRPAVRISIRKALKLGLRCCPAHSVAEANISIRPDAFVIGTAVLERIENIIDTTRFHRTVIESENGGYCTHIEGNEGGRSTV